MNQREEKILSALQSRKFLAGFVVFMAAVFAVVWGILVWNENRIITLDPESIQKAADGEFRFGIEELVWQEDGISITKDCVRLSGWILKEGEEIQTSAIWVVLKDMETGTFYRLPTQIIDREDVNDWMDDGLSYFQSGFETAVPRWKDLDTDKDYEVYVLDVLNGTEKLVPLGTTLKTWVEDPDADGPAKLADEEEE